MAELDDIKEYYANLLILQYRGKPKARATVQMGCDIYSGDGLVFQIGNILDIDTAQGAQLDIIGKILDCPRTIQGLNPDKQYFSFEYEGALGFSTAQSLSNGIFKTYYNSIQSQYALKDEDYRQLLKFKAIVNILRASWASMDEAIYNNFGGLIVLANNKNLTITYIIAKELNVVAQAALIQGYFRAPIGIGFNYIVLVPQTTKLFGFNKKGLIGNAVGFSTKDDIQSGTFLSSANLQSVV